jgi:dinuclear metal center YbgI/SA1388 family protein
MKSMTRIGDVISWLEYLAPLSTQENYDNSGLIVGNTANPVTGVLVSLDCTEEVVEEAIRKNCNVIVSHHPILFKGIKRLTGSSYVERTLLKAIKNDIALYAMHTNLDNYRFGVNAEIGARLGLQNLRILAPSKGSLTKVVVFVPKSFKDQVAQSIFDAGGGKIGDYDQCSFSGSGVGTFRPLAESNPFIGQKGVQEQVEEVKLEFLVARPKLQAVLRAMKEAHPYEEVAYDVISLENVNQFEGAGMVGDLNEEMDVMEFLAHIKSVFSCSYLRYTHPNKGIVKRVAFCGGSGSFLLGAAKQANADIFITGDYKYHDFFDAENQLVIADVGHYESEQFTIELLGRILTEKFTNFAVHLTEINTNPIKYL